MNKKMLTGLFLTIFTINNIQPNFANFTLKRENMPLIALTTAAIFGAIWTINKYKNPIINWFKPKKRVSFADAAKSFDRDFYIKTLQNCKTVEEAVQQLKNNGCTKEQIIASGIALQQFGNFSYPQVLKIFNAL